MSSVAQAQSSIVYNRLRMIIAGKADDVRKELPDLMKDFPDEPGVMFLNAVLTDDGTKALSIYEQITREHPQSEWADDAELRIVQFYALKKDTSRAQRELATFKRNYPLSEFLIHAVDLVKSTVGAGTTPVVKAIAEKSSTPTKGTKDMLLVESKPIETKTTSAAVSTEKVVDPAAKKYWGLQVGVYTTKKTAEAEAQKYRDQRMKVEVTTKDAKFGVVVGHYSSRESAEKSRDIIQAQCQCTPLVVEK